MYCERAGVEMTKDEWMAMPSDLRARYWLETDWGKGGPASQEVVENIRQRLAAMRNANARVR